MNIYDVGSPAAEDTDAQESRRNELRVPYRQIGRQIMLMGEFGRGTSRLIDELTEMVREGQYVGYYVAGERFRDAIPVAVNALGDETMLQMKAATIVPHLVGQADAANLAAHTVPPGIHLQPEPPRVDFGAIPTVVETKAEHLLARLPSDSVRAIFDTVRAWAAEHADVVSRARVSLITEPEDIGWTEVVLQLRVETDTEGALSLWEALAARLDSAKEHLSDNERAMLNSALGVHLVWNGDDEDEA